MDGGQGPSCPDAAIAEVDSGTAADAGQDAGREPFLGVELTDLGDLGGGSAIATAVNDDGVAVGTSTDPSSRQIPSLFADGGVIQLGGAAASVGDAFGINNGGVVVGRTFTFGGGVERACLWDPADGSITNLTPTATTPTSRAYAINASGEAVGEADGRAFISVGGAPASSLPAINASGLGAVARSINEEGWVVGSAYDSNTSIREAVAWDPSRMLVRLGGLGGTNAEARDVNAVGLIVGDGVNAAGQLRAFTSSTDGGITQLPSLPAFQAAYANAVADNGWIVGIHTIATAGGPPVAATLWLDGGVFDLNSLLPADAGWYLYEASDVNVRGQIVGTGTRTGSAGGRAFLLTLIPR